MLRFALGFALICFLSVGGFASSPTKCYTCRGINCFRTTLQNKTETCVDSLDICVTIFDKFAVVAKGCLLSIPPNLKDKCSDSKNVECQKCMGDLCNIYGREDFKCYKCEGDTDSACASNVTSLSAVHCNTPTAINSYCFTEMIAENTVRRGCSLSVKDQEDCLKKDNCFLCSVEDLPKCNVMNPFMRSGASNAVASLIVLSLIASVLQMIC